MKEKIIYVITDGREFKAFCGGRRSKVFRFDDRYRGSVSFSHGNPYLVYGPALRPWLGLEARSDQWYGHSIVVAHVTSGTLR